MGKKIDTASNVVLLLTCLLISSLVSMRYLETRNRSKPASDYKIGERMNAIPGVEYGGVSATMVLFIRSTCHFCTESMPFYRSLANADARTTGKARFVAVSSEDVSTTGEYLRINGVSIDQTSKHMDPRIAGTPTLVLVDSKGAVVAQWRGLLEKDGQTEVIEKLKAFASNRLVGMR